MRKNFKKLIRLLLVLMLFGAVGVIGFAQEGAEDTKSEKNFRASPIVLPAYTPEMGFTIAAGGLFSFKTNPQDEKIQRSSFSLIAAYGFKGAFTGQSMWNTYWFEDRMRIPAELWLKNMEDQYWGVGYDNARASDEGYSYTRTWWQINPRIFGKIRPNLFGGLNIDFNQTIAKNVSPGMAADPNYQEYGDNNYNGGLGLILQWDSRDIPVNAYEGLYLNGMATFYGNYLGSDNTYQIYEIDYRQYQEIVRPGSILAWQVYTRIGAGDVPYAEVTQVGTPFDLRG